MGMLDPSPSHTTFFLSTRAELESDDPRRHLTALGELSRLVCANKGNQQAIGAFLRDGSTGTRLLNVVLTDLHANDRTVRCAAARLVCQLAYENLVNQESIVQLTKSGVTLGWLYVFSVPPAYRIAYESQHTAGARQQSQRGLAAFLHELVADTYGDIYTQVSQYYATGCQSFLPLCWQFPRQHPNEGLDVLDPADHLLGFFLVPRESQFPELDDVCHDDLLNSLDQHDLRRLLTLKLACEERRDASIDTLPVGDFSADADSDRSFEWLADERTNPTTAVVAPLQCYHTESSSPSTAWNSVIVYAVVRLHSEKLARTFDSTTLGSVATLFRELAFISADRITATTMVWLPVLVAAIQHHPQLPISFKKQVQRLQRGTTTLQQQQQHEPWRVLLYTKLDQVVPVSWAVFLTQWRMAMTLENQLKQHQQHPDVLAPARRTSVCSVDDLRRSIVAQRHPHNYRDLGRASRFASQHDLMNTSIPLPPFCQRNPERIHVRDLNDNVSVDDDEDPLAKNRALFHRMQHSLAELDALGMKDRQEKQNEKQRLLKTVARNRRRAQDEDFRKRLQADEKYRGLEASQSELEQRKAAMRLKSHEQQKLKHTLATQRRQQQDAELEIKQQELAKKILERNLECRDNYRQRRRHDESERRDQQHYRCMRLSREAPCVTTPRPPSGTNKQPLSARRCRAAGAAEIPSPEVLRQRALVYGRVVSKITMAEAANRPTREPTLHQPHQITRSFSVFRDNSFNVRAPVVKIAPPSMRQPRSPRHRQMREPLDSSDDDKPDADDDQSGEYEDDRAQICSPTNRTHKATPPTSPSECCRNKPPRMLQDHRHSHGHANACATLVMRDAALAISERILIPDIPAPSVDDPIVPPFVIAAQYEALDDQHKRNFRARFNLKNLSHRLSFDVLQQYTQIVRRDLAWQAFHDRCGSSERVKHTDFVAIAHALGVTLSEKKLLATARQLDPLKSGSVEWKAFYTWWSLQYSEYSTPSTITPTRPTTCR